MIGRFQNRSDWNDISFRGGSQSQFNYHNQIPHYGWDFHYAGGTYIPRQTSGRTIPAVAPLPRPQPVPYCEICEVKLGSYKNVEAHNNGKKHRRMLELREELETLKTSNGQIPNSQINSVVQPKTVQKSGKNGHLVKSVSSESSIVKHKNYLQKDIGVTSEVLAQGPEGKPMDITGAPGHGFKHKIGGAKTGKYMKTNNGVRRPMESSKLDVNALLNFVESPFQIPALASPPGPVASQIMAPTPVVGSNLEQQFQHVAASQTQVLERKEHHEIQNPTAEMNNQPHAPADSNINTQTEDVSSVSAAIAIAPPKTLPPPVAYCKICEVKLGTYKNVEVHNNGKRHRRMLKLNGEIQRLNTLNGQIPNSQMNSVVQPKTIQKYRKNGHLVKSESSEASISKHKNYLQKDVRVTSEVPAQGPEGKPRDNTGAQGHGFKHKIREAKTGKYMKTNNGVRRPMESSKLDVNALSNSVEYPVQITALASLPGPVASQSQIMAPTPAVGSSFEQQFQHVSASQTQVSKGKEHHEIQNPTAETTDQLHAFADSNINAQAEDSDSATIAIAPPKGLMASQVFTPPQAVGSSFEPQVQHVLETQLLESKVHHEIQNHIMETNDEAQSISAELHAPAGSDINTRTYDVSSDAAAITIGPPKGLTESHAFVPSPAVGLSFEPQIQHVLQTEVSESKVRHEIQNPTVETNDQPQSMLVELHAPIDSDISTQTEDVSSDSAAIAIGPASQVSAPPPAVGSSFEPKIQHVLHVETEPQLSKAIADCESQNCTDEKNNQLLSSVLVEFNAPSGSSTNTQTADGNSKADQKMDVLTNQSGITQLSQVAVCLKCGDEGFPETLVFCNKCQVYALHRYCLDGPVIFTDDVTWFCEDCKPKVVDTSHDRCTLLSSGKSDTPSSAKDASQASIDPKNCIERVKKNKQKQQNIAAKMKVPLSDSHILSHHGLSQCSNNCKKEKKFGKESQPVPRDEANISEGSMIVDAPQPIADPVWRGSLCLCDGTVIRVLAHMSTLACSKVLEETRLLPEVLCADSFQRSVVWPKYFMKCGINEDSIALYFFPETESVERAFDKLVDDMISFDLAIGAVVENAELLVFPSTILPIQYRRFQAKYYLWGVFRARKTSPNTNYAVCGGEDRAPQKLLRTSGSSSSVAQ